MSFSVPKAVSFFFKSAGKLIPVIGHKGMSLLEVAHKNDVNLEGACEGSLACSTCHIILSKDMYSRLEQPSDRELDLLDQAYGVRSTSRLGCQVHVDNTFGNQVIALPKCSRNMSVDGYIPKPH